MIRKVPRCPGGLDHCCRQQMPSNFPAPVTSILPSRDTDELEILGSGSPVAGALSSPEPAENTVWPGLHVACLPWGLDREVSLTSCDCCMILPPWCPTPPTR